MQNNPYLGKFIVFEGLDGSGQSTQVELIKNYFIKEGYQVISTKEPTQESEDGRRVKEVLDKKNKVEPKELQELFTRDREEHLKNLITPALKEEKIVISDRYFFSTFAFGVSDRLDLDWLIKINNEFLLPDLTFILKVSPEVCIQRIKKRGEGEKLFEVKEKLEKVWQTYETLPNKFENVYIIDGEKTKEEVFSQIKKIVLSQIIKNKSNEKV